MTDDAPKSLAAAEDPCDCAPTREEKRALWGPISRRGALAVGAVGLVGLGTWDSIRGTSPAYGYDPSDYPTWEEVEQARANRSAKGRETAKIRGYIAELEANVAAAQKAAEEAADEYYEAQQAFYEAAFRAEELQKQADEESEKADSASTAAARVATTLARSGGDQTSMEVLFADSSENADDLLAKLGQMDKLAERNESIYSGAVTARDTAQSLSDQAEEAREERDRLQQVAQEKMEAAQAAQTAAENALAAQEEHLVTLEAQLAALEDEAASTVDKYREGVEARKAHEAEQRRLAEERRRKAAEEAARRAQEQGNSGGAPASPAPAPAPGGSQSGSGWVRPSVGGVTSWYGYRNQICGPSYCSSSLHAGVDMAAGCGAAIYAAHSGTVTYAGYNGGYGNYVRLDHGGGIGTGYAHIVNGGILVGYGQHVSAGQVIAYEGNTGNSFGCHVHFEVYLNGVPTDPSPFMASRGVYL